MSICTYLTRSLILYTLMCGVDCIPVGMPAPYSNLAFFFSDSNLTLTGISGIEGRTLVIYDAENGKPGAHIIIHTHTPLNLYNIRSVTVVA